MCGLTGIWQYGGGRADTLRHDVDAMAATLRHRGPDDAGHWIDPHNGVALGFRRLAILDLSPTGHQPMASADGRLVAVFNGEIYNYREIKEELSQHGVRFRGTSDTEVLLEAAARWGVEAAIRRAGGMFAAAVWDRDERVLYLCRDRVGKKPLYYAALPNILLFGSELKALRRHPSFNATVDRQALAAYCQYGYVPSPLSIYEGTRKLEPGCVAMIGADGALTVRRYWDARQVAADGVASPLETTGAQAIDDLDALLRRAVARRMIADVPIGAFLSGGIDSTTIVSLMQAQSSRPVRTFTIGFHEDAYDEARAARAVARHLRTDHTELYVPPDDARAVIPLLPELYDEPFADSSEIPTFLVSRLARQHVTVSLSGDGGDELFAGYTRYLWAERIWRRLRVMPFGARRALSSALTLLPAPHVDRLYGAIEPIVPARWRQRLPGDKVQKLAGLLPVENEEALYRRLVSYWKDPSAFVRGASATDTGFQLVTLDSSIRERFTSTERMMLMDLLSYLPEDILVKVDRASMGASLESRAPFLDHEVIEWSWRLPLALKRRDGIGKWILRQVLFRYVPPALIERPKMGFGVPIDSWLRGPLRAWAEALLDERRIRQEGFFDPAPIRAAWHAHLAGHRNEQYRLWLILMFEAWLERWSSTDAESIAPSSIPAAADLTASHP